jgi:hypothetical protein
MARLAKIAKSLKKPKLRFGCATAAAFVAARARTFASFRCAEFVSAVWRSRVRFPASRKLAGKGI